MQFIFKYFLPAFTTIILCLTSTLASHLQSQSSSFSQIVEVEYYVVAPFKSDFKNEIDYNPYNLLISEYNKCGLIPLNKNRALWPNRALNFPHLIIHIQAQLIDVGEHNTPELSVVEYDFNGNILFENRFYPKANCKRSKLRHKKVRCAEIAIESFKNNFAKKAFMFGYTVKRKIYPFSGPHYVAADPVSTFISAITWETIDQFLTDKDTSSLEGIYTSIDSTGSIYTLGIVKSEDIHKIVILDSNLKEWSEGDLKGTIRIDPENNRLKTEWTTLLCPMLHPR